MTNAAIGIDIGGTSTKIGLITKSGKVLGKKCLKTQEYSNQENYITAIGRVILQLLTMSLNCHIKLQGIGIGAPSGNYHTGIIERAANIPWAKKMDIVSQLHQALGCPVLLTNDANAAALGEKYYGAAQHMDHFAAITLGTGLGCGIFSEGNIVHGAYGFAGEIGHSIVKFGGRQCGCGNKGCLETYVSASGLRRTYLKMLANTQTSGSLSLEQDIPEASEIAELALNNDLAALATFEYTGKMLGWKLADLVLHTEPEAIFLMGGLANAGSLIIDPTTKYMEANLLPLHKGKISILPSALDNSEVGMLGAAGLIWQQHSDHTSDFQSETPEPSLVSIHQHPFDSLNSKMF